jgi:membrane-associated phospholipid phosphatase
MNKTYRLSAVDIVNFIYWLFMVVFYLLAFRQTGEKAYGFVLLSVLIIFEIFIIKSRQVTTDNNFIKLLQFIYPALFLIFIFDSIHISLPYVNPNIYDEALSNIDFKLLGFHPTVAIEKFINPYLTEFMYYLYFFYFFMPFIIVIYLYRKKMYRELDKTVLFLLLTFYGAYLLYYTVPALGPRFYQPLVALQQIPLKGVFLAETIRDSISVLEHNKFDAFPSLHAAVSLSVLIAIAKYKKRWLYLFIPIVAGIFISLIYCRYHYFIDIIGGIVWTMICYFLIEILYDKLYAKYFIPFYSD